MARHEAARETMERCKQSYESAKREFERANTALFFARRNYDDALQAYIELLKAGPALETAPAPDPERIELPRCRCGGFLRPTLMGRTICSVCGQG